MDNNFTDRCTRCDTGRLRRWHELSAEQQMLVKRLPASADFSIEERKTTHRWCTRCWFEATEDKGQDI